jgi:epoxyqueuosine reductase QueG
VAEALQAAGVPAMAPALAPLFRQQVSPKYGYASNWSERHAAYACGLGTFGLCEGLITPKGKAMRAGAVIARLSVPVTERPYKDHHAYCLFYSHGTCKKCVEKCPVNAISEAGHDKEKCRSFLRGPAWDHNKKNYSLDEYCCGKCQVDVPCSSHIPSPDEG